MLLLTVFPRDQSGSPSWYSSVSAKTLHGWPGWHLGNEHGNFETPFVVNAGVEAREVRNDGGLPAAAFANNGTAVWFGRGIVTVIACLDSRNGDFEERVFDQYTFRPLHRFCHWLSSIPEVSFAA